MTTFKTTAAIFLSYLFYLTCSIINDYESMVGVGDSMLPGIKSNSILLLEKPKSLIRHKVYAVSFDGKINKSEMNFHGREKSLFLKRLVGLPNDNLKFDIMSGNLISINGVTSKISLHEINDCIKGQYTKNISARMCQLTSRFDEYSYGIIVSSSSIEHALNSSTNGYELYNKHMHFLHRLQKKRERHVDFRLGKDEYFFLSDNRYIGFDSRTFGPVDRSHIRFQLVKSKPKET